MSCDRARRRATTTRLARLARAFVADPVETLIHVRESIAEREERREKRTKGLGFMPWPPCPYPVDENWEQRLHERLNASWPCDAGSEFQALWSGVATDFEARGIRLGRGQFGGWGDGEPGLVRAAWCVTRHSRPNTVVETGVGRGITSRFILEALERNGTGRLWSIDLPPPDRNLRSHVAMAVPERLQNRWAYVHGSSRRRLPKLLAQLERIDMFVHDSKHSERNLLFELRHAWGVLRSPGWVIADDIDLNCGFHSFRDAHREHPSLVCHAEPLPPDYGRQDDKGVFGIVMKQTEP